MKTSKFAFEITWPLGCWCGLVLRKMLTLENCAGQLKSRTRKEQDQTRSRQQRKGKKWWFLGLSQWPGKKAWVCFMLFLPRYRINYVSKWITKNGCKLQFWCEKRYCQIMIIILHPIFWLFFGYKWQMSWSEICKFNDICKIFKLYQFV